MRSAVAVFGVFTALLIPGRYADETLIRHDEVDQGGFHTFSVVTASYPEVLKCFLDGPTSSIQFQPSDTSQSTDKFGVLMGNIISQCQVRVYNFDENDNGIWTMYFSHIEGSGSSQVYNITVIPREVEEVTPDDGITRLSRINRFTRADSLIDISLSKESFEEECYVIPPNVNLTREDNTIQGVTQQSSSQFVSCRVTIGPMVEALLGDWSLCGKSKEDGNERCQPVNIAWNNNDNTSLWHSQVQPVFDHVVHYGGTVNPGVMGTGDLITCHVITPNGEDLVLTNDAHYPNIERVTQNPRICSVLISVTDSNALGNWTVYGKFRSAVMGLNEIRLPMSFGLYNENDPYEQAYNVTMLPIINEVVNLGNTINIQVAGSSVVDHCLFKTPSGNTFYQNGAAHFSGVSFANVEAACRITIGPITSEMVGEWQLIGKFNNGNLFTERVQTFHIIEEDPENPIEDENRIVETLPVQRIETEMGTSHRVTISQASFVFGESCHLRTPNGRQYTIMEGFNINGVDVIEENGVECGVRINITSEDLIGEWILIARSIRISEPFERRLPFTIYVEDHVNAVPNRVNMAEGTDLYVRLEEPTELYESCNLLGPNGTNVTYELDSLHVNSCGYIVKNLSVAQSGNWTIVYGNQIIHKAVIDVNVFASSAIAVENQVWTLGSSVHLTIGPEDAVYCKLVNAEGITVFDNFGRCSIEINRVTLDHQGPWIMSVGMPGAVLLEETAFIVNVNDAESSPVVTTSVVRNAPSVLLTCSVPSQYDVRGCKFRDHQGNIMIAHHGVGQIRSSDGEAGSSVVTSFESEVNGSSCTLRLTNPTVSNLGLWRCAVDTTEETFYAFINVTCPWLMQNPEVAASVILDPVITQESSNVPALEGEPTVMSCSIDASIRYCYFRARNGSIFNVRPGVSSLGYEYVGAGLHAGECGIRFSGLLATDSGRWSCHVGLFDSTSPEQSAQIELEVQEKMIVAHYSGPQDSLVLEGAVYNNHRVEYCRFIRIDGLGFTSENVPEGYSVDRALMANGYCTLRMAVPTMLNMHPWTVVAKLAGADEEIARSSVNHLLMMPGNEPPGSSNITMILLWISCILTMLVVVGLGIALVPKKNREWTFKRASKVRNSVKKIPLFHTEKTPSNEGTV